MDCNRAKPRSARKFCDRNDSMDGWGECTVQKNSEAVRL